jgi:hypothetical protein
MKLQLPADGQERFLVTFFAQDKKSLAIRQNLIKTEGKIAPALPGAHFI